MMIKKLLSFNLLNRSTTRQYLAKSFTYYLPAPPKRKTGYREKQFDKIFNIILSHGFAVESVNTVAHTSSNGNGMWLHFLLRPLTQQAHQMDLDQLLASEESANLDASIIEGIYPLNDI